MNKITVFYDHIRNACKQSGLSLEDVAAKLTAAGISGTEIEYDELLGDEGKALADKLTDLGLPVSSVYCHFRWELDPPAHDCVSVLSRLKELNIHYLLAIPGFKKPGQDAVSSIRELIPPLNELCEVAPDYDVQVLMEDFDNKIAAFGTSTELRMFMDNVPKLGCAFDTGNFYYFDGDVKAAYETLKDRISYVHCKDRSLTAVEGEDYLATISGIPMYSSPVGSGVIPMTEVLTKILNTGYTGPLAIEHFGSIKQFEDILTSAAYLNSLM